MTSPPSIVFENVSKRFRLGERHDSFRDLVPAALLGLLGRRGQVAHDNGFWALKDVSFKVAPGEAFGIIGPNGSGKSTTLKLLTKILRPTRGHCSARGRVGALIEVAAGFHPDLTGRENVYLQGAIMGMKRASTARRFDEIVSFAGVSEFIDTPVKRYSSGMAARLGFSIAAHLDPDVLIIDEVLAVGDLAFQERCYQRMMEFKREGVAIAFVSHNLPAVSRLCDRVGLLQKGIMRVYPSAAKGIEGYALSGIAALEGSAHGEGLTVVDRDGRTVSCVQSGDRLTIRAKVRSRLDVRSVSSSLRVRRVETNEFVYVTTSPSVGVSPVCPVPGSLVDITWTFSAHMARGHYVCEVQLYETAGKPAFATLSAPPLSVEETETEVGSVCLGATCILTTAAQQD